jgi:hypothetical protein
MQTAESEINKMLALSQEFGGTQEEREALVNALNGLKTLRKDVTAWLERQRESRSSAARATRTV